MKYPIPDESQCCQDSDNMTVHAKKQILCRECQTWSNIQFCKVCEDEHGCSMCGSMEVIFE